MEQHIFKINIEYRERVPQKIYHNFLSRQSEATTKIYIFIT